MLFQNTFKALSDPTRRDILNLLKSDRKTAGEISEHFNTSKSTISHHLSILKKADLIIETKEWKFSYFVLNASVFEELILWLSMFKEKGDSQNE